MNRYLKPSLGALLLFILASAVATIAGQNLDMYSQHFEAKEETALTGSLKLEVETKPRCFLGENPTIKIAITNTGRSPQSVKEAEYQKFSLDLVGLFQNDAGQYRKTITYDGSWDIPKKPTTPALPGETHVFEALGKREAKFVRLAPGESTTLELDLSKTFGSYLGVSKYKLTVKSEDGQKVVKEFEVYFDDEKSVPPLARMLASDSDDVTERHWAVYNLAIFSRARFVSLLEELVKTGNEKQRDFAKGMLVNTKSGWFDPLKLRVDIKDRYVLGETPIIAISIVNSLNSMQMIKEAKYHKFSLVLTGFGNDSKPQTKTCEYNGTQEITKSKTSAPRSGQQNAGLVRLAELESTTLSLDLTQCFQSSFPPGKYELKVKSADEQQPFKDQEVVKKFEVYVKEKSSAALLQNLKRAR